MSDLKLLQSIADRLQAIEAHLGISGSASGSGAGAAEEPRSVRAFDEYCRTNLDPFVAACEKLGGDAAIIGNLTKDAWIEMRKVILMASKCKEPTQAQLPTIMTGISAKLKEINSVMKRNEWEKHAKTVVEGLGCLSWLCVKPAPRDFIESFVGGSDYWANNIRREFRATNPDQVAFCDTFKALLMELMTYVKEHHTTGLSWNKNGCDISDYSESASNAAVSSAPAAASKPAVSVAAQKSPGAALFSELNKGGAITSGLKTVTKDQQTWRKEFKGGDAPVSLPKKSAPAINPRDQVKGTPRFEFNAATSKWEVEYQSSPVTVEIQDKKETVYIYGCINANISITNKCKGIIVDNCKKCTVSFDVAMASVEVVNSQRIHVTCRETVPSIAVDKTDGIVIQLPSTGMDATVVASKSSEMNLQWFDKDGELVEKPIPEQYIHRIVNGTVTADVSDLYTH